TRSGSRPDTKVDEQRMSATKPVATFGTSRARAAEKATAPSAVVAARIRIRRRRVIGFLRHAHQGACRLSSGIRERPLAGLQIRLAEITGDLADFGILYILQYLEGSDGRRLCLAIFG